MNPREFFAHLAALLWPHRCLVCGRGLYNTQLCSGCAPQLEPHSFGQRCISCWSDLLVNADDGRCSPCRAFPSPFRFQRHLSPYTGAIADSIRIIKYRPSQRLGAIIGHRVAPMVTEIFSVRDWDLIVPLPASARSLRTRGFNQCDLLACAIARAVSARCTPQALQHRGSTHAQASLPHDRRIGNVRRSFEARARLVQSKQILLVDDVTTTGATSAAAGGALLDAGARSVDLFTLARGEAWSEYRVEVHRRIGGRHRYGGGNKGEKSD